MQNYIKNQYGRETILIPNGANLYEEDGDDCILAWGLNRGNYILSVSRIIKLKGLQYLIAAFKNLTTDKKLVITGVGEYLGELEKMAVGDERIVFTGNQSGRTLDQLYTNACLFVQSSEMEGLSISLLEAMAHKTPCLVSDIEANLGALGSTGFSFINKDPHDLQIKLQYLLDNPDKLAVKSQESFNRAKHNFSWPIITQKVLEVYQRLVN
jgi:glycosyltransferase involved in cell wall biosynthesis